MAVGLAAALWLVAGPAAAHTVGLSQGIYRVDEAGVAVTVTIARGEARRFAAEVDGDRDGALSEVEVIAGAAALEEAVIRGLSIARGGAACEGHLERAALVEEDGLELRARYRCSSAGPAITLDFAALRRLGTPHRHVARILVGDEAIGEVVLSRMRPPVTVSLAAPSPAERETHGDAPEDESDRSETAAAGAPAVAGMPAAAGAPGSAGAPAVAVPPAAGSQAIAGDGPGAIVREFFTLGVEHILGGVDHLVFLLGLLLAARRIGPLVAVITAFTIGHSLSLALALAGGWAPSPALIEPLIAATIVYVGVENLSLGTSSSRAEKAAARRPWITGPFGLVHGFGFAGALAEVGLRPEARGWTLLGFNLGVEAGQLAAIALALPLLLGVDRLLGGEGWRHRVDLAVVVAGAFWLFARVGALL